MGRGSRPTAEAGWLIAASPGVTGGSLVHMREGAMGNQGITSNQFKGLLIFAVLAVLSILLLPVILYIIPQNSAHPEITLTILMIAGVMLFVAVFLIAVGTFSTLGLADRAQAFGMPEGTIRAVLALMLVIILSIIGIF